MTPEDQHEWDNCVEQLRAARDLDPQVLGAVSVQLTQAAAAAASKVRGGVFLQAARLLYLLQHEDGRGL